MLKNEQLNFDVAIATRNRFDALRLSIPLILSQSRQPKLLIVVDSSDDFESIRNLVLECTKDWSGKTVVVHTEPGLTPQRNLALSYVESDVVFFPDDDSLWHPNFADEVMKVYENDLDQVVGGVCGRLVTSSPLEDRAMIYKKSLIYLIKSKIQPYRNRLENAFFPKPFNTYARQRWSLLPVIPWLSQRNSVVVESMAGFRMSFRSSVVKSIGFDNLLAKVVGYSTHEDMEVSLNVLNQNKHLVAALNAKVFHHTFPGKRANGFKYGFSWILNYIYIVCKHMPEESKSRKQCTRYLVYKLVSYGLGGLFNRYSRDVFKGALVAFRQRSRLYRCSNREELNFEFSAICSKQM